MEIRRRSEGTAALEGRRRRRVAESHTIAWTAFRLGGGFAVAGGIWAVTAALGGSGWWGPLHAYLAGTVVLAISGASQLFTITWSAAPAPRTATAAVQRWAITAGVALALFGVASGTRWAAAAGAAITVAGLVLLGVSLVVTVSRSLLRRFDLSSRFYLLALTAGVGGVALGGSMGAGWLLDHYADMRLVHARLNLVGLVGLTIVGTLPTILPTFAHHKVVSGREAVAALWIAVASVAAVAAGLAWGEVPVGIGVLAGAASLATVTTGVVVRLGRRGLKGGLPYLQVVAGSVWLVAWAAVDGVGLISGHTAGPFGPWVGAAAAAGVGQILLGSLAYLVPVLLGPSRLGRNQRTMAALPAVPLVLANSTGLMLVAGLGVPAALAAAAWAADFALRLIRLRRS